MVADIVHQPVLLTWLQSCLLTGQEKVGLCGGMS
jgi:hypothetical protein